MIGTSDATGPAQAAEHTGTRPRRSLVVLFGIYLVLLTWVVLWKLEIPSVGDAASRIVKLVPFVPTAGAGASTGFDVVANLVLFVPFGVYLGLLAPTWRWWRAAGTVAAVSLALEVAQYVLAVGSSDLTDVVVNTAGGLTGLALLARARRRLGARTVAAATRACAVGTVLAVAAVVLVVVSPLRYATPEDVRCDPRSAPCGPHAAPGVPGPAPSGTSPGPVGGR